MTSGPPTATMARAARSHDCRQKPNCGLSGCMASRPVAAKKEDIGGGYGVVDP